MTKHLGTSSMVSSASGKKCKKPCQSSSSSSSCCTEQCVDCCTSQYQRLSSFRTFVVVKQLETGATSASWVVPDGTNRCGLPIPAPNDLPAVGLGGIAGAYFQVTTTGCTSGPYAPTDLDGAASNPNDSLLVAEAAYYFVNEFAYGPYEPGCHNDQVWGWYVNIATGELQLFTQTEGVPTNSTRLCLINQEALSISSTEKKQIKLLNKLFKLSKSAVKEINGIPSQEGNIVEVCDCKGQRWLLYINTAQAQRSSPLSTCNYQFAIVATKLC